jgi:drug/metabolite transporter (DMT)-like permease
MSFDAAKPPSRAAVAVALAALYLIWGSTYLAVKVAVTDFPPLAMIGLRNLLSGLLLAAFAAASAARRRDRLPRLAPGHLVPAMATGFLLILCGNGSVAVAQAAHVDSGVAALVVGAVPIWIALLGVALRRSPGTARENAAKIACVLVGFVGLSLLFTGHAPKPHAAASSLPAAGSWPMVFLALGTLAWAYGSVAGPRWKAHPDMLLATALAMLAGGFQCMVGGLALGEGPLLAAAALHAGPVLALAYLVVFGSVVGFTCYTFLLRHVDPAVVSTYAYVNPLVALALGHWLAGETIAPRTLAAAGLIVAAVVLVTTVPRHLAKRRLQTSANARQTPSPA